MSVTDDIFDVADYLENGPNVPKYVKDHFDDICKYINMLENINDELRNEIRDLEMINEDLQHQVSYLTWG